MVQSKDFHMIYNRQQLKAPGEVNAGSKEYLF